MELPTLPEYWDMLKNHDWHYAMSDDFRAYERGQKNQARLKAIAKAGGWEYEFLFAAFQHYELNWDHGAPLPERPGGHKTPPEPKGYTAITWKPKTENAS